MDTSSPSLQPACADDQAHGVHCGAWPTPQQAQQQASSGLITSPSQQHTKLMPPVQPHQPQQPQQPTGLLASTSNRPGLMQGSGHLPHHPQHQHAVDMLTPGTSAANHHTTANRHSSSSSPPPLSGNSTSVPGSYSGVFRRYADQQGEHTAHHAGGVSDVSAMALGTTPATQLTGISASGGGGHSLGPKPASCSKTRPAQPTASLPLNPSTQGSAAAAAAAAAVHPPATLHTPLTANSLNSSKPPSSLPPMSPTYAQEVSPPSHRRALTKPSEGTKNEGFDNDNCDLILRVGDMLLNHNPTHGINRKYTIQGMLGQGTFGQVVSCWSDELQQNVAVKVIKNQPAYFHQARVEIGLLSLLNVRCDPHDERHIVRMIDSFLFRKHLCIVFEKLDVNLFELLKRNAFKGLSLPTVQSLLRQLLDALTVLRDNNIMHCDLKPENILLKTMGSDEIKLIDFGSACFENRVVYSYIQSRFYRSPEVVLGTSYNVAIDMWSLGCVAAELFLGLPLFPGASEHDLMMRIVESLGLPPAWLLHEAKHTERYFRRVNLVAGSTAQLPLHSPSLLASSLSSGGLGPYDLASSVPRHQHQHLAQLAMQQQVSGSLAQAGQAGGASGSSAPGYTWVLLTQQEFETRNNCKAPAGKRYFQHKQLADIIAAYPMRPGLQDEDIARERVAREAFIDFLIGVLDLDPRTRWTPRQAAAHPFISGQAFTGPFQPPQDVRVPSSAITPPHLQPSPVRSSTESIPGAGTQQSHQHQSVPIPPQVVTGFNAPGTAGSSMAQPSLPSSLQTSFIMGTPHKRAAVARGSPTLRQQQQQQQPVQQQQQQQQQAGSAQSGRASSGNRNASRPWNYVLVADVPPAPHAANALTNLGPPAMKSPQLQQPQMTTQAGWATASAGGDRHQSLQGAQQLQGSQAQMAGAGDLALSQQLNQLNSQLLGHDAMQMAAQLTARALARAALQQQLPAHLQQVNQGLNMPFMSPGSALPSNMSYLGNTGGSDMQMMVDSGSGFNRGVNSSGVPGGGTAGAAAAAQAQALANMLLVPPASNPSNQAQAGWASRPQAAGQQQQQQGNWPQGMLGTSISAAEMQNVAAMAAMAAVRQAAAQLQHQGQNLGIGLTPQQLALLRQQQQVALMQVANQALQALPQNLQSSAFNGGLGNGSTAAMWGAHTTNAWDLQQQQQPQGMPGGGAHAHGHTAPEMNMTHNTRRQSTSSHQPMPLSRPSSTAMADGESPAPYASGGGAGAEPNGSRGNSAAQNRVGGGASPAEWDPLYADFDLLEEGESAMSPRDSVNSTGRATQAAARAAGRRGSSGQDSGMRGGAGGSSGGGAAGAARGGGPSLTHPSIRDMARSGFNGGGADGVAPAGFLTGQQQHGGGLMMSPQGVLMQPGAVPMDVSGGGEQQQHGGMFTWQHAQQGHPVYPHNMQAHPQAAQPPDHQFVLGSLPFSGMGAGPGMHTYQMLLQQQQQQHQHQQQQHTMQAPGAGDMSGTHTTT